MTTSPMVTDDKKMIEQAVTVLSAPLADERYRPVCDALQKGDLRQAQWTFLQIPDDSSSAASHFLTAFFLFCHGHWQKAKEEAARACQSSRCYREMRQFCENLQSAPAPFYQTETEGQPAPTPDNNTGTDTSSKKNKCCDGISDCLCNENSCDCCECLCDMANT